MIKKIALAGAVSLLAVFGLAAPAHAAITYFYAGANQTVTDNFAIVNMSANQPTLTAGDFHTLAELSGETTNGSGRQIVEIGWNVDPALYPTPVADKAKRHLFVGWWKNGLFCGYNTSLNTANCGASGYTTYAGTSPLSAGTVIAAATTSIRVSVQHSGGAWWFWAGTSSTVGDYIGYVNDTAWGTAWPNFTFINAFGEVAANVASPTTQMGDGNCSTSTVGANFGSMSYNAATTVNLAANQPTPTKYTTTMLTTRTFRYGGDGSCP